MTVDVQPLPQVARALASQRNRERRQRQLDDVVDTALRRFAAKSGSATPEWPSSATPWAWVAGRSTTSSAPRRTSSSSSMSASSTGSSMAPSASVSGSGSPAERLRWMMRDLLETVAAHQDDVWVFFTEWRVLGEMGTERSTATGGGRTRNIFLHILEEGIESGDFVIADPHITVMGIVGMVNDSYQWFRSNGTLSPTAIADLYCDVVLNGIASAASDIDEDDRPPLASAWGSDC